MSNGFRVLIVDDIQPVLTTYQLILKQHGHNVTGAASYKEATAEIDKHCFDVLLCDLTLDAKHSGFDVIDFARERHSSAKVVLLTGFSSPEVEKQASKRGVKVLFKPVEVKELLDMVDFLASQKAS